MSDLAPPCPGAALTACHECDLLQHEAAADRAGVVCCARCGAVLYRDQPDAVSRALAYTTGAAIVFVLANAFPLVGLKLSGEVIETTIFGTAQALYADGWKIVAAVVFVTVFVAPLIEICALLALLLPLRFQSLPPTPPSMLRAIRTIAPWRMVEVLMLGVLVALVKLAAIAEVVPGVALFSLGALVVLLAATVSTFDPRVLWSRHDAAQ